MSVYRFTIRVASDALLLRVQRFLMLRSTVLSMEAMPDDHRADAGAPAPTEAEAPMWPRGEKAERNAEMIAKYEADPIANSCGKLAIEYGVTRERICQILRIPNVIAKAKERREAVKGAYDDVRAELTEKARAELDANIQRGVGLVRDGQSVRQAVTSMGLEAHSTFAYLLGRAVHAAGIQSRHGRYRDFSDRRARVSELSAEGFTIPEIVKKMRADGSDPHIHEVWVYKHMPECKIAGVASSGSSEEPLAPTS